MNNINLQNIDLEGFVDDVLFKKSYYRYSTSGSLILRELLLDWLTNGVDINKVEMTKLYESLAIKYNTTWRRIERYIRYAKEMAIKEQLIHNPTPISAKANKSEIIRLYLKAKELIRNTNL